MGKRRRNRTERKWASAIPAAVDSLWHTRIKRPFRDTLEFFRVGGHMEYITDSEFMMQQWTDINLWSMHNFDGLKPEGVPTIWNDLERLLQEERTVSMCLGRGDGYSGFFAA
jgi:hypothetical protein